jgi:diguanylate cyclase (GGDEF)-like protein/hemerythrin-like metal-binding protein/PAS domain S-box-containing protein
MDYRFTDLVDIEAFRSMLKSFFEATGILHGLVDDQNNVISAIGWQQACTDFHRVHPCSNERCLASNRYLAEHAGREGYVGCRCENGLMDYATAIVVEGRQLATLYFGQLLHEPPDLEFFRRQAQECGFDEEAYLDAIRKVPVIPKERIEPIMAFYVQLAQMLARSGLDRLRQLQAEQRLAELNQDLAQRVAQRTAELASKNALLSGEIERRGRIEEALRNSQGQLQAILDLSPVGIGWSDEDDRIEYANQKFTELFGYTLADIPTLDAWYIRAYPDEGFRTGPLQRWRSEVAAARQANRPPPVLEAPIVCKDGSKRRVIVAASWVGNRRLVTFSDITERCLAEQRELARNAVLGLIATGASQAETLTALVHAMEAEGEGTIYSILLLDRDGRHLHTGAAPSLPGFYNQAIDGIEIGLGAGSCGTAAATLKRVVVADIQSDPYWAGYKELASRAQLASCWSEPILASDGRLLGTFAIYHRVPHTPDEREIQRLGEAANLASIAIEHHRVREELERQARTDFLTGLLNRRRFMELAEAEQARLLRYGEPFCLLMFDVDRFKAVNDRHGHKAGDRVLQEIAEVLRCNLREVDTAGRMGGEEFAVILPETTALDAQDAAERLRQAIAARPMPVESGESLNVTVSIGIAAAPAGVPADIEALLKQADQALYAAKNGGRNQVRLAYAPPDMGGAKDTVKLLKLSWHRAYECGQPVIDGQHRALFLQTNGLLASLGAGCPADRLVTAIEALLRAVQRHFQDEEAIFTEAGYPNAIHHAALHRHLMERANELARRFRSGNLATDDLLNFLIYELVAEHMLREDREFFPYLHGEPGPR